MQAERIVHGKCRFGVGSSTSIGMFAVIFGLWQQFFKKIARHFWFNHFSTFVIFQKHWNLQWIFYSGLKFRCKILYCCFESKTCSHVFFVFIFFNMWMYVWVWNWMLVRALTICIASDIDLHASHARARETSIPKMYKNTFSICNSARASSGGFWRVDPRLHSAHAQYHLASSTSSTHNPSSYFSSSS